ncbi:hypothetical protein [Micromonospora sp. NBC_01796]|uniref:hypothetical protein n=1 Tax=Micromonospora sp. NBC_01796 TaxID=2975987 RepID=UPI002DD8A3E8|nr:hypothetical protein [Micromonospora sp. NBC_01796]WSA88756.1 hypothetical protein OIE47_14755 [Micromonospora sp. NBC_01796]
MTVYRSRSQLWRRDEADAEAAREILAAHVPVKETGLCVVCLTPGPCPSANAAANRLVELGRPVVPPNPPRRKRGSGWRNWLTPHRQTAPLLTFAWRLRLDPPTAQAAS